MKSKVLSLSFVMLFVGLISLSAQTTKTDKFKVYGNCDMCKDRIEKAATSVDGVSKAIWDDKTKLLNLAYNPAKTSPQKVQVAIAKVGHDTEVEKAPDNSYNALPQCCKYERKKSK
jgi:periplasmic mercuric ion binding protein